MASIYSPLRYPGGKNKTYNYVKHLVEINKINTYIEPFAGGSAVALRLLINGDVKRIMINDYDRSIFAFWYSVIHYGTELIKRIWNTEISIQEWYKQKEIQENKDSADLIDLGFSTLFLNRTNRSGIIKAGVIGGKSQSGIYKIDCRFNKKTITERIKLISSFKDYIYVSNLDAVDFIKKKIKHTRNSLTFFDPPYYEKGATLYTNFYSHRDHVQLAKTISQLMRNRNWILTYDITKEIENIYRKFNYSPIKYYLDYSISKPTKGQEYMFFSKKINKGNINKYLKLVNN